MTGSTVLRQTANSCRSYETVNGSLTPVASMKSLMVPSMLSSPILQWTHGRPSFSASSLPAAT